MARIRLAAPDELEPDIAEMVAGVEALTGDSPALRALAHRPDLLRAFVGFYWPLQTEGMLSRKLVELIRLSIAQINRCPNCLAGRYEDSFDQGLTEEMVAALEQAEESPLFDDREKAAISYAQAMARDHHSVGDEQFTRLHRHFSEDELVELRIDVGQFVGMGRTFAVLDAMDESCEIPNLAGARA